MTYKDLGYNKLLQRTVYQAANNELNEDESSQYISIVNGSSIKGGVTKSANGKTEIDWEGGKQRFSDGLTTRIFIGESQ